MYKNYDAIGIVPAGNRLKLVQFPSLGIVPCCQVYCSKIVHTDYPNKNTSFLGTEIIYSPVNTGINAES